MTPTGGDALVGRMIAGGKYQIVRMLGEGGMGAVYQARQAAMNRMVALKLIRPEAYVVNTARGEVIDENALTRMIEAGEIAGAGLDVFEHEPAVNPKLVKLARAGKVVILPHMGSATIEGRIDMGDKVIINIRTFMDGHRPPDRVLPSML